MIGGVEGIIEGQPNKMDGKAAACTGLSVRAAGTRCPRLQEEGGETNEMNAIIKVDGQTERGAAQRKVGGKQVGKLCRIAVVLFSLASCTELLCHVIGRRGDCGEQRTLAEKNWVVGCGH